MADATCATCPWWEEIKRSDMGVCHHAHVIGEDRRHNNWWCSEHPLRQRDHLAELAAQGLCADPGMVSPSKIAEVAYSVADAMLAERAKGAP